MRNSKNQKLFVYQIRVESSQSPSDVVMQLTHDVWEALKGVPDLESLDPHRWPALYLAFRDVFKERLVRYEDCGNLDQCRTGLRPLREKAVFGNHVPRVTYTLQIGRDVDAFVRALALLTTRYLRDLLPVPLTNRRAWAGRLETAITESLSDRLFYSELCRTCAVRTAASPIKMVWP